MIGLCFTAIQENGRILTDTTVSLRTTVFGFFLHHTYAELTRYKASDASDAQTFSDASWHLRSGRSYVRLRRKAMK